MSQFSEHTPKLLSKLKLLPQEVQKLALSLHVRHEESQGSQVGLFESVKLATEIFSGHEAMQVFAF